VPPNRDDSTVRQSEQQFVRKKTATQHLSGRSVWMARFFFDIDDGPNRSNDDTGLDFPDRETARDNAVSALPDIARDVMPDGMKRDFAVTMRDEDGTPIFRATLAFTAEG
jgi:hypothetical protein